MADEPKAAEMNETVDSDFPNNDELEYGSEGEAEGESDDDVDEWDDELGDIDDLSDPESDLEDVLPVATTEAVAGKQAYIDACARQRIIPVSAFIKSMAQSRVSLRHYTLGMQGASAVAECLKDNIAIESLDLADTWLERQGATALAEALEDNISIRYLDVSHNRLGLDGGIAISKALRASQVLTDVCISNNKLCDRVATDIAESLRKNSTLTRLDLSHNNIRDKGGAALGTMLLSNGELKDLDLSNNNIRSAGGIKVVEAVEHNRTLTCLDVANNGFGDLDNNGLMKQALHDALADNSVLRHVNLSNNRLSSFSAEGIASGIASNKGLVSVVLDSNPFGKYGCGILMDALKKNTAIINVGMNNIEAELYPHEAKPLYPTKTEWAAAPPATAKPTPPPAVDADGEPKVTPRLLVSPRNLWRPMNLKLPSKANPTGTYRLYLSKPWERLAAARLAKVQCEEGIEPIATIRPNLAQSDQKGEPFDIVKNGKNIPETGILEVRFQMMVHPRRQTTQFVLNLADDAQQKKAGNLRAKASKMMHDAFRPGAVTLNGDPFHIPLDPGVDRVDKWKFPTEGELRVEWVTPELAFEVPFTLNLTDKLDRAVAMLMLRKKVTDPNHHWVQPTIDDTPVSDASIANMQLPATGILNVIHLVDFVTYASTELTAIDASTEEGAKALEALSARVAQNPALNVTNIHMGAKGAMSHKVVLADIVGPNAIWLREDIKIKPPKLEFDLVTLVDTSAPTATGHGNVLRVEEVLMGDCKSDKERLKELQKTLRREDLSFAADQAKKLVDCFEAPEFREKVLALLLQRTVLIQDYEKLRGCV